MHGEIKTMNRREFLIGFLGNLVVFGILEAGFGLLIVVTLDYLGVLLPYAVLIAAFALLGINLSPRLFASFKIAPEWLSAARNYLERFPAAVAAKFLSSMSTLTARRRQRRGQARKSAIRSFVYEVKA
jgi:hypothetical protein